MKDFQQIFANKIPEFEGVVFWPYLDTHQPPLVTVWVGIYITREEALTIPFTINGQSASLEQIGVEYDRVQDMQGGQLPKAYHYPGCLIITNDAGNDLMEKRLDGFTVELQHMFPEFDTFPILAKVALLEMMWGLGAGGLAKYTHLCNSVRNQDWIGASQQCAENTSNKAYSIRNQWTQQQFLAAAK
jgi:hypothetical protein